MSKYWSQTKIGTYYWQTIQIITKPFAIFHYNANFILENPELYYKDKEEVKIDKFLTQIEKIEVDNKKAQKWANKAAKYYLHVENEVLKQALQHHIKRLRKPLTEEEQENLLKQAEKMLSILQNLGLQNASI